MREKLFKGKEKNEKRKILELGLVKKTWLFED